MRPVNKSYGISAGYPSYPSGRHHNGIDFSCPRGTPVVAMRPGTVKAASANTIRWAGIHVVHIQVGQNEYDLYAHLKSNSVSVGQKVSAGDTIGQSGGQKGGYGSPEGNSTGAHLHVSTYRGGADISPQGAINWSNGESLPEPPAIGEPAKSPGGGADKEGPGGGNYEQAAMLIDIEEIRKAVFNPSACDGVRLQELYPEVWDKTRTLGRGWIVRDPAALVGIGDYPETDWKAPDEDEDGVPDADMTGQQPIIGSAQDVFMTGPQWGFRFLFNPSTHNETYTTVPGMDVSKYLMDLQYTANPPVTSATGSGIGFSLLLDRQMDFWLYAKYHKASGGSDNLTVWWDKFYEDIPNQGEFPDLFKYGTMYDLEYLFRCVNGMPTTGLWNGRKTSDIGAFAPYPVIIALGDGKKSRKIRGSITGITIQHQLFAPGMIPIRSRVQFNVMRISDSYYTNADLDPDNGNTTTDPAAPSGDLADPVNSQPGSGSGGVTTPPAASIPASSTKYKNITNARPIFEEYAKKYNWNRQDWEDLVKLWSKESQWNHKAKNPSSSAYGIPQMMLSVWTRTIEKNSNMSIGAWKENPTAQIKTGLELIRSWSTQNGGKPYGRPSKAWEHSQRYGWY